MFKLFIVGLGGAVGTLARYIISRMGHQFLHPNFPASTLIINVTGSFIIGFIVSLIDRFSISANTHLFIFIGVLGGYTTFSTFSLETFHLIRDGQYRLAFINVIFSVILSVGAVFLGYLLAKILVAGSDLHFRN